MKKAKLQGPQGNYRHHTFVLVVALQLPWFRKGKITHQSVNYHLNQTCFMAQFAVDKRDSELVYWLASRQALKHQGIVRLYSFMLHSLISFFNKVMTLDCYGWSMKIVLYAN